MRELDREKAHRVLRVDDAPSGLRAFIVLDDLSLGPAAGGVRTRAYESDAAALQDGRALARAMTLKCALGGLSAGGGKAVVLDHPDLDRPRAFRALGEAIASLDGAFRTAGDVGTGGDDLASMAEACPWVHTEERSLAASVARGLIASLRGALGAWEIPPIEGRSALVQGVGSIGSAVTRALRAQDLEVYLSDLDGDRANALASETGAHVRPPEALFAQRADLVIPCALGGVIDEQLASALETAVVCGGANNLLASREAEAILDARGVAYVPDIISSAGAVIDGIGEGVMGLADRGPLIEALEDVARGVLTEAREGSRLPTEVAESWAKRRLADPHGGR